METISVRVACIKDESPGVKTFRLVPADGQKIDFNAGQFTMLVADIDGGNGPERIKRAYSIASSPTKNHIDLTIKKVENGKMTTYLHEQVKEGDFLEITKPMGKYYFTENMGDELVLIGGGCGITPMMGISEYCTDKELDTKVKVLYCEKTPEDLIYKEKFPALEKKNPNLSVSITMTRSEKSCWDGHLGRIDLEYLKQEIDNPKAKRYYLCGSTGFVTNVIILLKELGVEDSQIKKEMWG